jgi:hypothetical protein
MKIKMRARDAKIITFVKLKRVEIATSARSELRTPSAKRENSLQKSPKLFANITNAEIEPKMEITTVTIKSVVKNALVDFFIESSLL